MKRGKAAILGAAAICTAGTATDTAEPPPAGGASPARDPNIAVAEELCMARAKATAEAYDRFIRRHSDHPLAQVARREREQLLAGKRPKPR